MSAHLSQSRSKNVSGLGFAKGSYITRLKLREVGGVSELEQVEPLVWSHALPMCRLWGSEFRFVASSPLAKERTFARHADESAPFVPRSLLACFLAVCQQNPPKTSKREPEEQSRVSFVGSSARRTQTENSESLKPRITQVPRLTYLK